MACLWAETSGGKTSALVLVGAPCAGGRGAASVLRGGCCPSFWLKAASPQVAKPGWCFPKGRFRCSDVFL